MTKEQELESFYSYMNDEIIKYLEDKSRELAEIIENTKNDTGYDFTEEAKRYLYNTIRDAMSRNA